MKKNVKNCYGKNLERAVTGALFLGLIGTGCVGHAIDAESGDLSSFTLDVITVEAKRPDWEQKLSPGTVTVIRPEQYKGEQKTLPDLLKNVPGVHVREVNGKGQYTTVTVRGSTAAQVGVFVDGVMSNLGGDSAVDISTIPVKNVERIEVYRGYIPARFGGTFIGGVINVVTKKPQKANVSAELGKSSYGGKSASLEVTAPLGSGTLLMGINRESSTGDFPYDNYAAIREKQVSSDQIASLEMQLKSIQGEISDFNKKNIDDFVKSGVSDVSDQQGEYYKNNENAWVDFVRNGGMAQAINNHSYQRAESLAADHHAGLFSTQMEELGYWQGFKQTVADLNGLDVSDILPEQYSNALSDYWLDDSEIGGYLTDEMKQKVLDAYAKSDSANNSKIWVEQADPEQSQYMKKLQSDKSAKSDELKKEKDRYKAITDNSRHRQYNDRKSTEGIIKWQNENWMIKGTWNKLNRHLPDSLWGDSYLDAPTNLLVDVRDIYYASSRKQTLDNKGLLLENRNEIGNLEWGWRADYLHQDKKYRTEHKLLWPDNFRWKNIPLREWSQYKSDKYNLQLDGSYKLNDRQMLDFQTNYSHERLNVDGSLMDQVMTGTIGSLLGQMRNKYEQEIFNIQVQDSITLDQKGSLVLTPALRYNRSKIVGHSNGKRFGEDHKHHFFWIHEKDSQADGKMTWQLALKKAFNDQFTLRATGGTYFRLLNMYEIAGDGAGILPSTSDGKGPVFPQPEYGKQFDFSALWKGKVFGADNSTTLTYFWRDSDRMLQLYRVGLDYWSYFNDNKGKSRGVELQSNWKWNKFSVDTECTYTKMHLQRRNSTVGYGFSDVWATYQPEWEGNLRLTWSPNDKVSIFDELHYTGEYFTYYGKSTQGEHESYLTGRPVPSLMTMNAGVKWKPVKNLQVTFGCNDVFNRGPRLKIFSDIYNYESGYINPDYVMQGRTFYGTLRYEF
ncbi:MAG: TonB-dependent receptor [Prevotellaceae bacterium]|nr:TonB-dependent receptor [Prevotellaceae bacterium]